MGKHTAPPKFSVRSRIPENVWKEISTGEIQEGNLCTVNCLHFTFGFKNRTSPNKGRCRHSGREVIAGSDLCPGGKEIK